jgi:hypothetical protein
VDNVEMVWVPNKMTKVNVEWFEFQTNDQSERWNGLFQTKRPKWTLKRFEFQNRDKANCYITDVWLMKTMNMRLFFM